MSSRWAAPVDLDLDVLDRVQRGLTVGMIMAPRNELMTCQRDEMITDVMKRNTDRFSYLPVAGESDSLMGLFHAYEWFDKTARDGPIGDDFETFSEALVIGADASIYEFVVQADVRPTRLVVSGDKVSGLISISDLQKLPVRASLFTLITAVEMAMGQRIESEWPDSVDAWKTLLSADRQVQLQKLIARAHEGDSHVSDIALTQFCDKATIIRKARLIDGSKSELKDKFRKTEDLRNSLAHANFYAETPEAANDVCATVRLILQVKKALLDGIAKIKTEVTDL
ncbi:hypothetical protein [Yoonia sp. MH D7]